MTGSLLRFLPYLKRPWICILLVVFLPVIANALEGPQQSISPQAEPVTGPAGRLAVLLDVQGPIGPATAEYLTGSLEKASIKGAEMVIIRIDTPGGLDAATRDIVKAILNSPVPVASFVSPGGARAASAGTYILYASHVAAMSPATNVGAATPVSIMGGNEPGKAEKPSEEDRDVATESGSGDTMNRKAINDAVAYIRGLADRRGRNADWAEMAVREAASITADQALETGVIDLIVNDVGELLKQIHGRIVEVQGQDRVLDTESLVIEQMEPDWKSELLGVITSPTIAYLLLLIGVYGLIFEGYNPGAIFPGVIGAICLLVALYAFQMLPVNYAGFALLILGIILIIGEAVVPSFGALGIGGIISIVIGSIILIDTDIPGFVVSRPLIGAIALVSSLGLMAIIGVAVKARRRPVVAGREELIGTRGTALQGFARQGTVFVHSESWNAVTESPLLEGQAIVVTGIDGLTLKVRPSGE